LADIITVDKNPLPGGACAEYFQINCRPDLKGRNLARFLEPSPSRDAGNEQSPRAPYPASDREKGHPVEPNPVVPILAKDGVGPPSASSLTIVGEDGVRTVAPSSSSRHSSKQHCQRLSKTGGVKKQLSKTSSRKKRNLGGWPEDDDSEDENEVPWDPSQPPVPADGAFDHNRYSCPFYKMNPYLYVDCDTYNKRIAPSVPNLTPKQMLINTSRRRLSALFEDTIDLRG
jgi:hypothetical protein